AADHINHGQVVVTDIGWNRATREYPLSQDFRWRPPRMSRCDPKIWTYAVSALHRRAIKRVISLSRQRQSFLSGAIRQIHGSAKPVAVRRREARRHQQGATA